MPTLNQKKTEEICNCPRHGEYIATTTCVGFGACPSHSWTTNCPRCEEELTAEFERKEAEYEEMKRRERIASKRTAANIPSRFADSTLQNYVASTTGQRKALSVARSFAENFESVRQSGSSLILCGNSGCGKTHLSCAIANHLLNTGKTAIYSTVLQLIRSVRDTWRPHSSQSETEVVRKYRNSDLLILDEVGASFGSEAEQNQLFDILDGRYGDKRPTVIVSNQNGKVLQERLGLRIFDRMMEKGSAVVVFNWKSYRQEIPSRLESPGSTAAAGDSSRPN
jgi:DNA replication protein DnaC